MKRPKILRIITHLPVGGVENRLLELLPTLQDDFEVQLVCIRTRGTLADNFIQRGIPVNLIPIKGRWSPVGIGRLAYFIRRSGIDLVHTHMYPSNISGTAAARIAGVSNVVGNVHNVDHWANNSQILQDKWMMRLRKKVVCVSQTVKKNVIQYTGVPEDKCVVIYNGSSLETFRPGGKDIKLQAELDLKGKKVVGIVARIVPQKDHETFLKCAVEIKKKVPMTRFLVVGEAEGSGELRRKLQQRAIELGLGKDVIFLGERRDIAEVISLFDVAVLSSLREGFGTVIVEAMAMGIPTVATDAGGATKEVIEEGKTGFVVPCRRADLLAERVVKILTNKELSSKMNSLCLNRAKIFSLEAMTENTKSLYKTLLPD